ncbi:MAG TPA: nuclear transport factor 2 family protein [Longimicrobiaceae bacterium]|jgi:ketosteroid isomerase-like protein|nr:nuclear transport factor 2 family protein [Longimicrobiaceae bacterium]
MSEAGDGQRDSRIQDLVHGYFIAFQNADRAAMEALLPDDFTFTSPYDDHISRAAYFERCWPHSGSFRFREPMKFFVAGDECVVLYETEGKPGGTFRNAELFTFRGDLAHSVEVFFGFVPGANDPKLPEPGTPSA